MLPIYVFGALAFAIVIAIFAVQNTTPVSVSFMVWHADNMAVSVLVLISAALGAAVMLLISFSREVGLRLRARTLGQQLRAAQERLRVVEASQAAAAPVTETTVPILPAPGPQS